MEIAALYEETDGQNEPVFLIAADVIRYVRVLEEPPSIVVSMRDDENPIYVSFATKADATRAFQIIERAMINA